MKHQRKPILPCVFIVSALLFLPSTSVAAQEVENEREFDYMENSGKGPKHWGDLKKEWKVCNIGDMQSPIDLLNQQVHLIHKLGFLKRSYKPCNATVKNRGHDISLQWEGNKAGSMEINGSQYYLQQCHWHSPSEHTVKGRRYEMELHMVHVNEHNKYAVMGFLYQIGRPDAFLAKLRGDIKLMNDRKMEREIGVIDANEIKMKGRKYYKYMGSLTVPPCTEGVTWIINKKIKSVSRGQVKLLRMAVHDYAEVNARPLQALNRREIQLHRYIPRDTSN